MCCGAPLYLATVLRFVVLKNAVETSDNDIAEQLVVPVREKIGAVAVLREVYVVPRLPKTR